MSAHWMTSELLLILLVQFSKGGMIDNNFLSESLLMVPFVGIWEHLYHPPLQFLRG